MKPTLTTLVAGAILLVTGVPASAQTIKLATLAPEGSPWHEIIVEMADQWERASGGKIDVRIYPGGVAGDEPDMVRKMRIGQIHVAALSGMGLTRIAMEVQALQIPMMIGSDDELDYVRERMAPKLEAAMEDAGFKVLTWGDAGWVYYFTQQPVVHPDDLKPLKLFSWAGDPTIDAWKSAGFQPVPLAATEIHTALQSGLINAVAFTPIGALSFQWFGLAINMTDLKLAPLVGALVVSTRMWRTIPDELKPPLLQAAREAGARMQRVVRRLGPEAVEVMKKHGLVVHRVPPKVAAEWERRIRAGYQEIIGRVVPPETAAEVERLRDEYRALHKGQ